MKSLRCIKYVVSAGLVCGWGVGIEVQLSTMTLHTLKTMVPHAH